MKRGVTQVTLGALITIIQIVDLFFTFVMPYAFTLSYFFIKVLWFSFALWLMYRGIKKITLNLQDRRTS